MTAVSHIRTCRLLPTRISLILQLGLGFLLLLTYPTFGVIALNHITLEQAKAQLEAGESTQALETIEELIDSLPPPEILQDAYFLQATILKEQAQIPEAISVMRQLLEEFPFSTNTNPSRLLLAELYSENEEYSQALLQLYQALDYAADQELRRTLFQRIRQAELDNGHPLGAVKAALNEMMLVNPTERLELEQFTQNLVLQ